MSLLTMVQAVCDELSLPRPMAVVGAADQQTRTMLALANREGNQLSRRGRWQELIQQATLTTVADTDQGALEDIAPGYRYMLSKTIWNRSMIQRVEGGMYPEDWAFLQAFTVVGPYPKFRIENGHLLFLPVPAAGMTFAFEYMSRNWCQSENEVMQNAWRADTDTGILDEDLMTLGIKWRFLRSKGLDYAEEFNAYETSINDAMARGQVLRDIFANDPPSRLSLPGIPAGNWEIS